jgi:gliding motility-associated-like protein
LGRNAVLGLPPFIMSYFDTVATVSFSGTCFGGATNFTISGNTTFLDSVRWFFDDPATGIQNTSTLLSPTHIFSAPGIFNVQLVRYIDCIADTTIQPIEILPPPVGTQNVSICPNQNFTLPNGSVITAEGVYNDTISDINGCDSVVVTTLSFYPVDTTLFIVTICEGQSHTAGGQPQTTTGIYSDLLQNQYGCDSVVITDLTVTPRVFFNNNVFICEGQSYTLPGGNSVNSQGIYNDTLIASSTCDSIVITNLSIIPRVFFNNDVALCPGESYTLPNGNAVTTAGTYFDTLVAFTTCDSVVITNLSILPVNNTIIAISICEGESYFAGGQLQTTTGSYIDTLLNQFGCDSIITTNLTVNPVSYSEVFDTICNYESYTLPSGNIINAEGIYIDTLINALQCDSIITTYLNVLIPDSSFRDITVCYGDSFFVAGNFQTLSGIYTETYPGAGRCDSFLITNLTVLNPFSFERDVFVCYEKTFFVAGNEQSNPGVYYDTLLSALGCDSLIITNFITSYDDSCGCESYFIPNAFSPNGDGENDFFEIYGGCFKDYYFSIHNRWGEKVFETENPRDQWDGYFNGKPQSQGVYVYYLRGTTFNNIQHKKKGSITLIK